MRIQIISIILVIFCFLFSCTDSTATQQAENLNQIKFQHAPALYIIGRDGTGSYNSVGPATDFISQVIKTAPPASLVIVRWITDDSYLDSNSIVTDRVPSLPVIDESNPFKRQNAQTVISKARLNKWRQELVQQIGASPYPRANFTDIYGFLVVASERLRNWNNGEAYIILLSDLENNVDKYRLFLKSDSLKGADVLVAMYEAKDPRTRVFWESNFKSWGAASIKFLSPDESFISLNIDLGVMP